MTVTVRTPSPFIALAIYRFTGFKWHNDSDLSGKSKRLTNLTTIEADSEANFLLVIVVHSIPQAGIRVI